jgi:hypothetical protein
VGDVKTTAELLAQSKATTDADRAHWLAEALRRHK